MQATETHLKGCFIIQPTVFKDDRGYFYESYNKQKFDAAIGREVNFIQDNQAYSTFGVLRGLHFQIGDFAQAKLVRALEGKVLDVAVDIRKESETYGQYVAVELSGENMTQLFVPRGFAHGYVVLSDTAVFSYKVDNVYSKESEGGVIWNDPELNIDWKIPAEEVILSEKDRQLENLKTLSKNLNL